MFCGSGSLKLEEMIFILLSVPMNSGTLKHGASDFRLLRPTERNIEVARMGCDTLELLSNDSNNSSLSSVPPRTPRTW